MTREEKENFNALIEYQIVNTSIAGGRMLFVVDTSCLIVLQRLDWLEEILSHVDDTFLCPPGVIQELKNNTRLLKRLKQGMVVITNVDRPIAMTSIQQPTLRSLLWRLNEAAVFCLKTRFSAKERKNWQFPSIVSANLLHYIIRRTVLAKPTVWRGCEFWLIKR